MSLSVVVLCVVTAAAQPGVEAFQAAQFVQVNHVESLPADLRRGLEHTLRSSTMADPGKPFEAGDAIADERLPRRRLIFAGVSEGLCFVYYEHGGRGLHQHLLIFERNGSPDARLLQNLSMSHGVTTGPGTIAALKAFIAGGNAFVAKRGHV